MEFERAIWSMSQLQKELQQRNVPDTIEVPLKPGSPSGALSEAGRKIAERIATPPACMLLAKNAEEEVQPHTTFVKLKSGDDSPKKRSPVNLVKSADAGLKSVITRQETPRFGAETIHVALKSGDTEKSPKGLQVHVGLKPVISRKETPRFTEKEIQAAKAEAAKENS